MTRSEPLWDHAGELAVLAISGTLGLLFAWKLFRWEKDEQIPRSRKLWSVAFVIPFLLMGAWMNSSGSAMAGWAKSLRSLDDSGKAREAGPAPPGSESGLVSDFEDGSATATFGSGWAVSTDRMMGGKSTAQINVIDGGANGTKGSLLITGEIVGGTAYPWAGAMFMPGPKPFAPANLSSKKAVIFWAKGDGKTYRVMLFSASGGPIPAMQAFQAGSDWKEYTVTLASFNTDGRDIEGLLFSGGPSPGSFAFQIDQVHFDSR
jgi:hypothetical protein